MKNNPSVAGKGAQVTWLRAARRLITCSVMLAVAATSAVAQFATSTVAGSAPPNIAQESGNNDTLVAGLTARFTNPQGLAIHGGYLYIADTNKHKIRRMLLTTGEVSTVAGTGSAGSANGNGTAASFNSPQGIAVMVDNATTYLMVADTFNHIIRRITISDPLFPVTTYAGTGAIALDSTSVLNTAARFSAPRGVAVIGTNVYIADTGNNAIRASNGTNVTLLAGSTTGQSGTTSGSDTTARFNQPYAIATDGTDLYVADRENHALRKIVVTGAVVSTIGGTIGTPSSSDAGGLSSSFRSPSALSYASGTLYVADTLNHTIRSFVVSSGATATIGGTAGSLGYIDGLTTAARFQGPAGIAADGTGNVYVADTNNHSIRRLGPATAPTVTTPATTPVSVGATATFSVTVGGNPTPTIVWERQPAAGGSFTALSNSQNINGSVFTGVNTATLTITNAVSANTGDLFRATVTNGVSSLTSSSTALVVQQAPQITNVNATSFSVGNPGTFTFTATGSPAPTFTILSGSSPGGLNQTTGVYTFTPGDNHGGVPYVFTVKAENGVGTAATQSFTLSIQNGATIATQPGNFGVGLGGTAQFSVVASGTPSTFTYQWYRNAGGVSGFFAISDVSGSYLGSNTATLTVFNASQGMNNDQFQVVVSNGIGSAVTSNPATLTIQQAPQITSLNNATFAIGTLNTFQIQATGSPAPTFSIVSGSFPPASLDQNTGIISYTPADATNSPYSFTIQASNGVNPVAQQAFVLTVTPTGAFPGFTTQPGNVSVSIGQVATFTVVATGSPLPTLQWQRQPAGTIGFTNIPEGGAYFGTTTATLTISAANTGMNGDLYQVVASNTVNNLPASATSNTASLSVNVGTIISTIAGSVGSANTVDGTGLSAQFTNPFSIAADPQGNLYVADPTAHVIRKITSAGVVTTFAGMVGVAGTADGVGSAARFNGPSGVAVDGGGNVYVADTNNHVIRGISTSGTVITLAGTAGASGSTDGLSSAARFSYPFGLAVDNFGTIYVADTFNHMIRRIAANGSVSTMGGAAGVRGTTNGTLGNSRFAFPTGIAVDPQGFVYVADSNNGAIRRITQGNDTQTYAGTPGTFGTADGAALTVARFNQPNGVAVDSNGVVYVADTFSHTIRRIASAGGGLAGDVSTLAGLAGTAGASDGQGTTARFSQPNGITVDTAGNIYIADTQNRIIRRSGAVTAATITTQPVSASVAPGGTATFTVAGTGSPLPSVYQWQRKPADGSTDFVSLPNDSTYSGVTTSTLTVSNVQTSQNNDQFRVIVSNFISPEAVSNAVTLSTVVAPPVFTSAANASFKATELGAFTVTASGNPSPTFSLTGAPSFVSIDANSGVLSGTASNTTGSPFTFTITANNGVTTTQSFTLTVTPAIVAPAITTQPVGGLIARGQNANFSVTATGTALTYQWYKNSVAISGATSSTLTLTGVQYSNAGLYTVVVNNSLNTPVTSTPAVLQILTPPTITNQPHSQTAITGTTATFSVDATGFPAPTYQWRANGLTIAGATDATYTIPSVQAINAANYDVIVGNGVGGVLSSLAQLTVSTTATVPVITAAPTSRTVVVGSSTVLYVGANAAPAPGYQWRKNNVGIPGANGASLTIQNAQLSDSASYDVVVTNSAGSITSSAATVTVVRRSYAGFYLGSFGGSIGNYALYVRADNSAVLLGYLPGTFTAIRATDLSVSDTGGFSYIQGTVALTGTIADNGSISGSVIGVNGASLSGSRTTDFGSSLVSAGYYQGAATNTSSVISAIITPAGQGFALVQTSASADGGQGAVESNNRLVVTTSRQTITATVTPETGAITATVVSGSGTTTFAGATDSVLATQRLANISSRARVGTGDNVAIAGFVISGQESKPVLIRAVGPALVGLGVPGALTAPKLELFRAGNNTAILSNTGWTTAGNTSGIQAATTAAGAFQLGANSADSVIFTTLAPGAYTAVISSANNTPGVALAEVYDLSTATAGQKLFNISTRANTGLDDAVLTAGISISGSVPKRLLIRGVGPTLTTLGVAGALAQPQLLIIKDGATVATATNWTTSPDAAAITAASTQVGAFGLGASSADAAMIISLAPGNYSAQVKGLNNTTGVAIIEIYELP